MNSEVGNRVLMEWPTAPGWSTAVAGAAHAASSSAAPPVLPALGLIREIEELSFSESENGLPGCPFYAFVVSGRGTINDVQVQTGSMYVHVGGATAAPVVTPDGGDLVLAVLRRSEGAGSISLDGNVVNSLESPWKTVVLEGFPGGITHKGMIDDPVLGEAVWLVGCVPWWYKSDSEVHTHDEEFFLLAGDITMEDGMVRAPSYFRNPPRYPHGPSASTQGFLALTVKRGYPRGTTLTPVTGDGRLLAECVFALGQRQGSVR